MEVYLGKLLAVVPGLVHNFREKKMRHLLPEKVRNLERAKKSKIVRVSCFVP